MPQNPASSFTPTRHLRGQLAEIGAAHHHTDTVDDLCRTVGLEPHLADRYPHQLSGGQLQRAALAAALATGPRVLVADEPTSGLNPDLAMDLLRLLRAVADHQGMSVLLITHDVAALAATGIADRIIELHHGRLADHDGERVQSSDGALRPALAGTAPMTAGVGS